MDKNCKSIIEVIKSRTSCRTFNPTHLNKEEKKKIVKILRDINLTSPFNEKKHNCRFEIVKLENKRADEKKKLGTYGFIKGAHQFIVGITRKSKYIKEEFGYLFEKLILDFTEQGYGTCWLGGTFNRTNFAKSVNLEENEHILCISPIGIPSDTRRLSDKLIRRAIKAKKRKKWDDLFFEDSFSKPLSEISAGKYRNPLEMVRLAPSGGNKQPWRIIKEMDKNIFHFYWIIGNYSKFMNYNTIHKIDMGIAVCHFDLTTKELGLKGNWKINQKPPFNFDKFKYVITWEE